MERVIECAGNLSKQTAARCMDQIMKLVRESTDLPITISIRSTGGDAFAAVRLAQLIAQTPVTTIGKAEIASSAAAYVFLSCKRRLISPEGYVGLHAPTIKLLVTDIGDNNTIPADIAENGKKVYDEMVSILRSRTKISESNISKILRTKSIEKFAGARAIECGLADEILP